jgi:hypothetical protein
LCISGFPQNKAQAICAQQVGLLARQVFVLLPDTRLNSEEEEGEGEEMFEAQEGDNDIDLEELELKKSLSKTSIKNLDPDMHEALLKDISTAYHKDICKVLSYYILFK